jgi:CheY-like chemotaxis protein
MMTSKKSPPSLGAYVPPSHPAPGPLTPVLVIDDEPVGAATTLGWLAEAGYPTAAESDGDAVLRLVRTEVMRLVVSELYIPCGEGACVVTALKQDRTRLPRLRVLVYSRHTAAADDAWALAAGCDAVLHKPASAAACVREVRRLDGGEPGEPGEPEFDAADAAGGAP